MKAAVIDPFRVVDDASMPSLGATLDPDTVREQFNRKLKDFVGDRGRLDVQKIEVTRHKPGKRCVIEYDVVVNRPGEIEFATLIGKVRARRYGKSGYRMLKAVWDAGFQDDSPDGISVPEPIGAVGKLQMWLQRKVSGHLATDLIATGKAGHLGRRIAESAHKLHTSRVVVEATHSTQKEVRILRERLPHVCRLYPLLRDRIFDLLRACDALAATLPRVAAHPIHRDFYPDQIIVDGDRIFLLDFDLCCQGDPAVDIGNFLAHVAEQSLREQGTVAALQLIEDHLEQRFLELAGEEKLNAVRVYRLLTLVRHIYLSTIVPGRDEITLPLLEVCEDHFEQFEREASLAQ